MQGNKEVAYIMNTLDRPEVTQNVTSDNIQKAGYPIKTLYINDQGSQDGFIQTFSMGMARQINTMVRQNKENIGNPQGHNIMCEGVNKTHDIICLMGNDITMSPNWLTQAVKILENQDIGLVGFSWRGYQTEPFNLYGHDVVEDNRIFGCWVFRSDFWRDVGYFSEFSKYGLWDSDYNIRAQLAGYRNVYLKGYESEHLCNDAGTSTPYRKMKDEELSKAEKIYKERSKKYSEDCYHITKDQNLRCKPRIKGI